jgi:pimeloyl-ACP methyl ester carboxylesterase
MKKVLFVPGMGSTLRNGNYDNLMAAAGGGGRPAEFVPIDWNGTSPNDWLNRLRRVYRRYEPRDVILAGFSMGAVTALRLAAERPPAGLLLCSLSPYFRETVGGIPEEWSIMNAHLVRSLGNVSLDALADKVDCTAAVLVGGAEHGSMYSAAQRAATLIVDASFYAVPGAGHDMLDDRYIDAIGQAARELQLQVAPQASSRAAS